MSVDKIKFRCSSLGYLMANDRSGKQIGESVKTHLIDVFVSWKYKRREEVQGKFLDKGNEREEDSITLLSRLNKKFYKKNDVRLTNDYISGECDIYLGQDIEHADETIDTKTSWSAHTFFRAKKSGLEPKYEWQGHGYMWLTGAKKHTVAYCLVNGTAQAIMDEKRKLSYRFSADPETNPEYIKQARQIEINHIFDLEAFKNENPWFEFDNDLSEWVYDIPMEERMHCFAFSRDESKIEEIKKRCEEGVKWIESNLCQL